MLFFKQITKTIAVSISLCAIANGATITPSGGSDAVVNRDWGNGFSASDWVTSAASMTLGADYDPSDSDYRYWRVPELQFPISSLSGRTNVNASLSVYVTNSGSGNMQLRYLGDGTGNVIAENLFNSGSIIDTFASTVAGWHSFDISEELQQSVDAGHDWARFTIRSNDWFDHVTIAASEDAVYSPQINIVPEPSTLCLTIVSIFALVAYAGRHRRGAARQ